MKKTLLMILAIVMLICVMSITAFAADSADLSDEIDTLNLADGQTTWNEEYLGYAESHVDETWVKRYFTTSSTSNEYGGSEAFTVDGITYYYKQGYTVKEIYRFINTNKESESVTDKTLEITNGIDVEADTRTGSQILEGFVPIINTILGVIVVLITLGLAVFTSFDVCYIVFPVFRNKCEDQKMSGQGAMVSKAANGDSKLRFVSDEAQYVVQECNVSQGKNPLSTYLGKRVVAYIIVAIILFILLTGNISIITNIALKVVSGIMKVLGSLAA